MPNNHFAAAPRDLLRDPRIPNAHVITTFLAIQDHVDGLEGGCFPSHARIAELSHQSRSTVIRDIKVLIELGYLRQTAREGTSNFYDVRWSNPESEAAQADPEVGHADRGGVSEGHGGCVTQTHEEEPPNNNHSSELSETSLSHSVQSEEEIEQRVAEDLGATVVSVEEHAPAAQNQPVSAEQPADGVTDEDGNPEPLGPRQAAHRVGCSRRAQTPAAVPLDRAFRPSTVGYTLDDMRRDYPSINPIETLESFLSHHISKGDTSRNWLEKFFSYCQTGERMAKERESGRATDSMGLPTDPTKRRVGDTDEAREARRKMYEQTEQRFQRLNDEEKAESE